MARSSSPDAALDAYEACASDYDAFTAHHNYDEWTAMFERLAVTHGLRGRRLLDVGCGTGKSFLPFLEKGYEVTACDISERMLAGSQRRSQGRVRLVQCDARRLPVLGSFDLVLALDDVANYLTEPGELSCALRGMAANLAPHGVLMFDANSLASFRECLE